MHSRLLSPFLRSSTFCLLAFGLLAFLPSHVLAATDTVTSTADDGSAGTLRIVLADASPGDTIVFASGVTGTITLQSILTITQPATITGPGAANLALSGPGGSAATPFADMEISATSGTVAISDITIENGNASSVSASDNGGGVLVDSGANVNFTDCDITGNSAGYAGAGIYNSGTASLTDCTISGNAAYFAGGGLFNGTNATLTMTGCFITGNYAVSESYNTVTQGGALENNGGTLTMVNCVVAKNSSQYDVGGIVNAGPATITGCTFTDNGAFYYGGAISNYSVSGNPAATLTLTNDIFYGDSGGQGPANGEGYNEIDNSATATASYCDIGEALGTSGDGVTDGGNNKDVDPKFENSPTNLQIGRISPCLGAGTASAPDYLPTDIAGATRTDPPAIGAYDAAELGTGSTVDTLATASSVNPSYYGQNAVVTATVTPANSGGVQPSGTITFTVNGTAGSPITVTNGVATLNLGTDAPGTYTITATYSGDANYNASGPTSALTQTINQATPTITFTESPNPATTGQYFTLTATVSPPAGQVSGAAAPSGDVTIDSDQALLSNGVATLQEAYYQPQTETATAVYGGDTNYTTVTATPVQFSVQGNDITGTSVSVSSSQEPSAVGQSVTFTANLNLSYVPSGTPAPTGTMTFIVDPNTSSTTTSSPVSITEVNGQYQAQYTATGLTAGQHQIEVNYSGDSNYGSNGSGTVLQYMYSGTTPTTITVTGPSTVAYGDSDPITATVSPAPGAGGFGSDQAIVFSEDGYPQGASQVTNGVATFTPYSGNLTPGPHTFSAIFSGDSTYAGSTSNVFSQTVTGGVYPATVTVMSSANPSIPGQSVTFSASVYSYAGGPIPTGTVEFYLNPTGPESTPFDTETLVNGYATSTAQIFTANETDTVYAVYSGDANDDPENASLTQVVSSTVNTGGATATATTLASSANPSTVGQTVTITAAVAPSSGSGTPTGTVTFTVDGTAGSPVTLTSGSATYSSSALTQGSHSISAAYSGDSNYAASSSSALTQTVNAASVAPVATTTTLTNGTDTTAPTVGQLIDLVVTVAPTSGTGTPTGTVTFTLTPQTGSATTSPAETLANGITNYTTSSLAAGTYTVTAAYSGDSSNQASTGGPLTLIISPATTPPSVIHMFNPGLQMIALDETYSDFAEALNGATPPAYDTYNGSAYSPFNSASEAAPAPGKGFWVYLSSDTNVYDTGAPVTGATSVALTQGWNLIGSPYSAPFPVASLQVKSGGSTYSLAQANQNLLAYTTLYTYPAGTPMGGNYTPVLLTDNLQPFTGYWLYAFRPCTLVMPVID